MNTSELLTTEELAARLKVRPGTIRTWSRSGKIPRVKLSHKVIRFDLAEVLDSLSKNKKEGAA